MRMDRVGVCGWIDDDPLLRRAEGRTLRDIQLRPFGGILREPTSLRMPVEFEALRRTRRSQMDVPRPWGIFPRPKTFMPIVSRQKAGDRSRSRTRIPV